MVISAERKNAANTYVNWSKPGARQEKLKKSFEKDLVAYSIACDVWIRLQGLARSTVELCTALTHSYNVAVRLPRSRTVKKDGGCISRENELKG